jgi:hypothetical protein
MKQGRVRLQQPMWDWLTQLKRKNKDIYPAKKFTRRITIKRWKISKKNRPTAACLKLKSPESSKGTAFMPRS